MTSGWLGTGADQGNRLSMKQSIHSELRVKKFNEVWVYMFFGLFELFLMVLFVIHLWKIHFFQLYLHMTSFYPCKMHKCHMAFTLVKCFSNPCKFCHGDKQPTNIKYCKTVWSCFSVLNPNNSRIYFQIKIDFFAKFVIFSPWQNAF